MTPPKYKINHPETPKPCPSTAPAGCWFRPAAGGQLHAHTIQLFGRCCDAHDRLLAYLSHLPQLTASALMQVVGEHVGQEGLDLAGRGLADTTRLASSPSDIWTDITATNADEIGAALDDLIALLKELRADLAQGDRLGEVFAEAARWRERLPKSRG